VGTILKDSSASIDTLSTNHLIKLSILMLNYLNFVRHI
jgi:hypothetical protein